MDHRLNATEIAPMVGISAKRVGAIIAEIETNYFVEMHEHTDERKKKLAAAHDGIVHEAYTAWQESKLAPELKAVEVVEVRDGDTVTRTTKYESVPIDKAGDPAHLRNVLTALKGLRDIWGVDAPRQLNTTIDATLEVSHVDADEFTDDELAAIAGGNFIATEHGASVGGKSVAIQESRS